MIDPPDHLTRSIDYYDSGPELSVSVVERTESLFLSLSFSLSFSLSLSLSIYLSLYLDYPML